MEIVIIFLMIMVALIIGFEILTYIEDRKRLKES